MFALFISMALLVDQPARAVSMTNRHVVKQRVTSQKLKKRLTGAPLRRFVIGYQFAPASQKLYPDVDIFENSFKYIWQNEWGTKVGTYKIDDNQVCILSPEEKKQCFSVFITENREIEFSSIRSGRTYRKIVKRFSLGD